MTFDISKMDLSDGQMEPYFDPKNYQLNENTAVSDLFYTNQFKFGNKVMFTDSVESKLLMGNERPKDQEVGVVVKVKTTLGNITQFSGKVFAYWDSLDRILPVYHEFLENLGEDVDDLDNPKSNRKVASNHVSSIDDLKSNFLIKGPTNNPAEMELIHKSTQELWSLEKDASGGFKVQRLFESNGTPIKEGLPKSDQIRRSASKRKRKI